MEKISMRYTKEKSLKSRRPNEKASEMKGRIARGLLSVALGGGLTTIMPFNANARMYIILERRLMREKILDFLKIMRLQRRIRIIIGRLEAFLLMAILV